MIAVLNGTVGRVAHGCDLDEPHPFHGKTMTEYPLQSTAQRWGDISRCLHPCVSGPRHTALAVCKSTQTV